MKSTRGFTAIPLPALEQLLGLVEQSRLECPLTEAELVDAGFRGLVPDVMETLHGVDASGTMAALRAAIAERVHRPPPRLDLVWTGPETRASVARSTSLVVERLFRSAERTIIVGGYASIPPKSSSLFIVR